MSDRVRFEAEQSAFLMAARFARSCRWQHTDVIQREAAVAGMIAALLNTLTPSDVEDLAPTDRRRFLERCRFWADLAGRTRIDPQPSGVLAELRQGYRVD